MDIVKTRQDITSAESVSLADQVAAAFLAQYHGHTLKAYRTDLVTFSQWLARRQLEPFGLKRSDLDAYRNSLRDAGRAPRTIARKLCCVTGFYKYALDEGLIASSPAAHLRRVRVPYVSPTLGLDETEAQRFLAAARQQSLRDHAICLIGVLNGLRVSEIYGADVESLTGERGHRCLAITRKGGDKALVPLAPVTYAALMTYLGGRQSGPLFIRPTTHKRLVQTDIYRIVKRVARKAGIDKKLSPQSMRHAFVTIALNSGATLRDVQDAAGHKSADTTRMYDRGRHNLDRHPTYGLAAYLADDDITESPST